MTLPYPYSARLTALATRLADRLATEPDFAQVQKVVAGLEVVAAPYLDGAEPLAGHQRYGLVMAEAWRRGPAKQRAEYALLAGFHEAGHAVAALVLGLPLAAVAIDGQGVDGGRTQLHPERFPARVATDAHRLAILRRVTCWLAGPQAELIEYGTTQEPLDNHHDEREAKQLAFQVKPTGEGARLLLDLCRHDAREILQGTWPAVRELACLVAERGDVSGDEAAAILRPYVDSPLAVIPRSGDTTL